MSSNVISPDDLRKVLDYNPSTGLFTWKWRPVSFFSQSQQGQKPEARQRAWNAVWAGKPALVSVKDNEYLYGRILDRNIYAHRAAWCICNGEWPKNTIDHINGNRTDNRISNLRDVTHSENVRNFRTRKDNTSGKTGVFFCKRMELWFATISIEGKPVYLGSSKDIKNVKKMRMEAEKKHGYVCRE